jgi:hypothetical protein
VKISAIEWFWSGERGASSEAMVTFLFSLPAYRISDPTAHPYDPADLRRCRLAIEAIGLEDRIGELSQLSPTWAKLVEVWPELCKTMDEEAPKWRGGGRGRCPRTYQMMQDAQRAKP